MSDLCEAGLIAAVGDPLAPPKRKRGPSTSPTARTLAECRKRGWVAQVVERWNPHARIKQDLFGVIDVVAIVPPDAAASAPGSIVAIQACSGGSSAGRGSDHATRRDKILAEPRARKWIEAGGVLELWSWAPHGGKGKRRLWTLRAERITVADFAGAEAA